MGNDTDKVMPEYGMELVFPVQGIAGFPAFAPAVEFSSVIPAAGLLAEVSPDGPLVSQLGTGHF
jgi:hypothetical protein